MKSDKKNTSKNHKIVSDKKRRFKDSAGNDHGSRPGNNILQNPKRGAPGFLMTCEQGKERKCQREGLEIISHYYKSQKKVETKSENSPSQPTIDTPTTETTTLSLEDELKLLQEKKDEGSKSNFGIFQTGCRGTVFVLCTVPGSEMIPSIKAQKEQRKQSAEEDNVTEDTEEPTAKKQRTQSVAKDKEKTDLSTPSDQETKPPESHSTGTTEWDPVPIVRQILQDITEDSARDAPSSRFVTRMIPMQATCYTSEEELQLASRMLMKKYLPPSTVTFGVALKRRLCQAQLTKQKIIDIVAAEVIRMVPNCKVNLDNPDVTIVVEICKTLCGISVIPKCNEHFRNFNLAVARDEQNKGEDEE